MQRLAAVAQFHDTFYYELLQLQTEESKTSEHLPSDGDIKHKISNGRQLNPEQSVGVDTNQARENCVIPAIMTQ